MEFSFDSLSFLCGVLLAGLCAAFVFVTRKDAGRSGDALMLAQFKALAQDTLAQSQEQLLTLATERLKTLQAEAAHEADKRQNAFSQLVEPIKKGLTELDQRVVALDKTGAGLNQHLTSVVEGQRKLHDETSQLVQALRSPNVRGRWGEMQLQRALEASGMVLGADFEMQVTRTTRDGKTIRPDFLIRLTEGQELVIDSKTPIDGYLDALREGISHAEQNEALARHAKAMRAHVADLGKRAYWQDFNGMDFVILFVPGEGILSAALSRDPQLMEDAANARVMLASPLSILGLLRLIHYGRQQQKLANEAHKIAEVGSLLYERLSAFLEHFVKIGNQINTVNKSYDEAVGSLKSRVLPSAIKMQELGLETKTTLPDVKLIDKTTRSIAANE